MSSAWAALRKQEASIEVKEPTMVSEIMETDPYYFVALDESNEVIAEGELPTFKLRLPIEYLDRPYKSISRDKTTLVAVIHF